MKVEYINSIKKREKAIRPIIDIFLQNRQQEVLLDSGASISLVGQQYCDDLDPDSIIYLNKPIILYPFNSKEKSTVNHSRVTIVQAIALMNITIQTIEFRFPFFIFSGKLDVPILEVDFLEIIKMAIDFGKQKYHIPIENEAETEQYL